MQELSLRSVREALGNGPPFPTRTDLNGDQIDREEAERRMINHIESQLGVLVDLWQQQQFDQTAVWKTLLEITLPDRRPEEIFLYQRIESGDALTLSLTDRSVGSMLIRKSLELGRVTELREQLESRWRQPRSELDAWTLLLQLAIEENDVADALLRLKQFSPQLLNTVQPHQNLPIAITLLRAWTLPELRSDLIPAMTGCVGKALDALSSVKADNCATVMSLVLARELLRTGDTEAALRLLEQCDALVSRRVGSSNYVLITHDLSVAQLLLQFGLEPQAMMRIREIQSLVREPTSRNPQIVSQAALLTRRFQRWPEKDRYEFLRQFLLVENPAALLSPALEFDTAERPPDDFLELLPEPLRENAFDSAVSGVPARVVSSITELIIAAHEAGESDALRAELLTLQKENHRASPHLFVLFFLEHNMADEAAAILQDICDGLQLDAQNNVRGRVLPLDLLVALKASGHPETQESAIEILDILRRLELAETARQITGQASAARDFSIAAETGKEPRTLLESASPGLWLAAANSAGTAGERDNLRPIWMAHDGVIMHQAGAEHDSLYFPWPLGGTFEFRVSSLGSAELHGGLGFDGLVCEFQSSTGFASLTGLGVDNPNARTLQLSDTGTYSKRTVKVTPTQLTFLVNGHAVYKEQRSVHSSPFLALFARGSKTGIWRFPEFSGSPEILPEVALSQDPGMRGWSSAFFGQTRASIGLTGSTANDAGNDAAAQRRSFDWTWDDGIITGRRLREARRLDDMMDQNLQGLLRYDRPLMSGETLTWEFEYSPGKLAVHPALGRLAFLIQPDGVHLHWMSTGSSEWTLLPADNEVRVRSDQPGPADLPLQEGLNQASLSLQEDTVSVSINGVAVFEYTLRPEDGRQFGLFHFRDQTEARARNIVLTGDWPESLTAEHIAALTRPKAASLKRSDQHAIDRIVGEQAFSTDVADVVRYAGQMDPEQRFRFLEKWVIPGDLHRAWRMFGDLAPSDPAPSTAGAFGENPLNPSDRDGNAARQSSGGFVISPAIELVRAAKVTGNLATLRASVESVPDSDAVDQRAKLASLLLLAIEDGRAADSLTLIQEMSRRTKSMTHFRESQIWPELITAQQTLKTSELRPHTIEMLRHVASVNREAGEAAGSATTRQLLSMISTGEFLEIAANDDHSASQIKSWQPFRITRADSRNEGLPQPVWAEHADGSIQQVSGFEDDMLCYPTPLSGDFEFECELTPVDGEHLLVGYGGFFLQPAANQDSRIIPYGRDPAALPNVKPVADLNSVWRYRLVVSQQQVTVFVNNEELTSIALSSMAPPWLCLRAATKPGARIRDIRLNGRPTIPESIRFDTSRDLSGWSRPCFGGGEPFATRNAIALDWRSEEAVIVGPQRTALAGTKTENLIQYFRPMMEDGTITYSFLYEPGAALAHPALDRLAFLLHREQGVLIHEITNGPYERSGLDPANAVAEPEHQLVKQLPLFANDWNVMKVQLEGDTVKLFLNDMAIFRRRLENTNQRTFGLFHFRDESSAEVRSISWQGNWKQPAD